MNTSQELGTNEWGARANLERYINRNAHSLILTYPASENELK